MNNDNRNNNPNNGNDNPNNGNNNPNNGNNNPIPKARRPDRLVLGSNPAESWKLFKQRWNIYQTLQKITDYPGNIQVALFIDCLADDALAAYNGFHFDSEEDDRTVAEIVAKFDEYAIGEVNVTYERYTFNKRQQNDGETFDPYLAELRTLIKTCDYCENCRPSILRDKIVIGIRNSDTRTELLKTKNIPLNDCINLCRSHETANKQTQALQPENVNKVQAYKSKGDKPKKDFRKKPSRKPSKDDLTPKDCLFCDSTHVMNKHECPAWGQTCKFCKGSNHFASKCPKKKKKRPQSSHKKKVNRVTVDSSDSDDDDDEWLNAVNQNPKKQLKCRLKLGGQVIVFQVDTGATINVLPKRYAPNNIITQRGNKMLRMWNDSTTVPLGTARQVVENPKNNRKYNVKFTVVEDSFMPLIGLATAVKMNLIKVLERNMEVVAAVNVKPTEKQTSVVDKFPDVFDGKIGSLPGEVSLKTKPDAVPVVMPGRRTPLSLRDQLQEELNRMEKEGVIAKVSEPTPWLSQSVIVHKRNKSIRLCIDPKELNKVLIRERYVMPTLDEKVHELGNSRIFTKADLSSGYWHVHLDEQSSFLTTFQTCHGLYRWKRLPFGLSVSAEIFQRKILEVLNDLPGVLCIADDVIIHGADDAEHDKRLENFLERCSKIGIKLNKSKFELKMKELTFMGHKITEDGIHSDPEKVTAINSMPVPTNVSELRRFIGCVNFLGKFLPNLSKTIEPLTNLLKKDVPYNWSSAQDTAFNDAKKLVTTAPVLVFYDSKKPLTLENDASEFGIGSALFQGGKPVAFASRSMSDVERRYAQIEKEMLAIQFGLTKFHQYTFGRDVNVITDHKPLVAITKKPLNKAPRRLQNMLIRIQDYSFTLEYQKGCSIPVADTLSRAPVTAPKHDETICSVFYTPIKKKYLSEVTDATRNDPELNLLKATVLQGWPDDKKDVSVAVRPYFDYRDEITVQSGLLLRGERIIIPSSLRSLMKRQIHAGHMGINSCLRRARESVYWPGMSGDVRQFIEACNTCRSFASKPPAEPMIMKEDPGQPFDHVATDLFSLRGKEYLITVDCSSNFIEVDEMHSTTSKAVIKKLKRHFARYGIPSIVYSDNGPQYAGIEFKKFAQRWNFQHITSSPGYPQSNGAAEAAVKAVKQMMRKCVADRQDFYLGLLAMRNTPTEGMGSSPSQRLMGRRTRSLLPTIDKTLEHSQVTSYKLKKDAKKAKAAEYHTERKEKPILSSGQQAMIHPIGTSLKTSPLTPATVKNRLSVRSYEVETENGTLLRRNRSKIQEVPEQRDDMPTEPPQQTVEAPVPSTDKPPDKIKTRSGRVVKTPARFKDT